MFLNEKICSNIFLEKNGLLGSSEQKAAVVTFKASAFTERDDWLRYIMAIFLFV